MLLARKASEQVRIRVLTMRLAAKLETQQGSTLEVQQLKVQQQQQQPLQSKQALQQRPLALLEWLEQRVKVLLAWEAEAAIPSPERPRPGRPTVQQLARAPLLEPPASRPAPSAGGPAGSCRPERWQVLGCSAPPVWSSWPRLLGRPRPPWLAQPFQAGPAPPNRTQRPEQAPQSDSLCS